MKRLYDEYSSIDGHDIIKKEVNIYKSHAHLQPPLPVHLNLLQHHKQHTGGVGVVAADPHLSLHSVKDSQSSASTAESIQSQPPFLAGIMQSSLYPTATYAAVSTGTTSSATPSTSHVATTKSQGLQLGGLSTGHAQMRIKGNSSPGATLPQPQMLPQQHSPSNNSQFQRLKVEDALTYLDMVKFKFGEKPQVYNDFLDIMKEFKTQSIDTPGVITRVSSLFNGYPELIMGFNTFLPPGYKIEVQKSDQGYAFQVSVSVPSPTGGVSANDPNTLTINTTGGITSNAGQKPQATILCGSGIIHNNVSRTSGAPPPSSLQQPTMSVSSNTSHLMSGGMDLNNVSVNIGGTTIAPSAAGAGVPSSVLHHHSSSVGSGDFFGSCGPQQQQQQQPAAQQRHQQQPQQHLPQHLQQQQQQQQQQQHQLNAGHNNALSLTAAALQTQLDTPQNQPVEFNHAINYVNKIKNRFQGQPEKYKRFLEILHAYQKEQRNLKETSQGSGPGKHLTEQEVYSQVAKLFENQSDLLAEFGQFLPDATNHMSNQSVTPGVPLLNTDQQYQSPIGKKPLSSKPHHHRTGGSSVNAICPGTGASGGGGGNTGNSSAFLSSNDRVDRDHNHHSVLHSSGHGHHHISERHISNKTGHITNPKRSPPYQLLSHNRDMPPAKKHKPSYGSSSLCRDFSIADAAKYATLNDYAFFDKLRKAVKSQDVYNNFLRCLVLFNQEIISKYELVQLVTPFLGKFPELMRWFRDFLGQSDTETLPFNTVRQERPHNDHTLDIDYSTAKRLGASYCIIPPAQENLKFSGRTKLCNEVLNNQWVSFPTWSEDSSFVGSRKNQYEEYMYRCEDERFELDVVIETNASTIRSLEGVSKKLNRMSPDEINKYHFEDCLGASFHILHHKALKRIYGDKAPDIIEGLKRNPAVAVPVVLRRLKSKEEEWRDAQKGFNKIWREQNEKYYLKSLDYQGINFKQNDVKVLRSKSLLNDIETLFEERNEQNEDRVPNEQIQGPHLTFTYRDRSILDDAANLLIHHVKRQTGIQKVEKRRIKHILRQFVPDLFFHPRQQLSEDDRDEDDEKEDGNESPCSNSSKEDNSNKLMKDLGSPLASKSPNRADSSSGCADSGDDKHNSNFPNIKDEDFRVPLHAQCPYPDESYTLFMANNNWYLFLRLHATLCDRLVKIYDRAVIIAQEERLQRNTRKESTAIALRLKPKATIEVEEYYPAFLDMVQNLLDGNMESNTYEDTLREMFGIHAYIAFTLDKVVSYAVRQLQHCVTERNATACTNTFLKEQKRGATGGLCVTGHRRMHSELQYSRTVERILQEDNCFKIYIYKRDGRMTIEMIDSEPEDLKKVDEQRKWSKFKDKFPSIPNRHAKPLLPLYLNRNICKMRKIRPQQNKSETDKSFNLDLNKKSHKSNIDDDGDDEDDDVDSNEHLPNRMPTGDGRDDGTKSCDSKLNDRLPPERAITKTTCYDVSDDTECALTDSKILFTTNKDSYLYKRSAFLRAKQTHATITKRLAIRFRTWLRSWQQKHVTDSQAKQCTDWLMGTGVDFAPNKTWIQADNNLGKTPYVPYNRYRVRLLSSAHHATAAATLPTGTKAATSTSSATPNNSDNAAHDDSTNSSSEQRDVT